MRYKKRKLILASELTACLPKIRSELGRVVRGSRLLFVPTAAIGEGWSPEHESHVRPFEEMGFDVRWFDLKGKSRDETAQALRDSSAVYVSGGNTFYLLEHMRKSGFFDLAVEWIDRGMVYIGSSAGTVAATPDIGYAAVLDNRLKAVLESDAGLGLIDFAVLPHMDHPDFKDFVQTVYRSMSASSRMCLGLNDDQMVVVEGRCFRIV